MGTFDQFSNKDYWPSPLYGLIGDTVANYENELIVTFNLDEEDINERVPALCELAAGALVWILINREEGFTEDYVEGLFKMVRSKTSALLNRRAAFATLEAGQGGKFNGPAGAE